MESSEVSRRSRRRRSFIILCGFLNFVKAWSSLITTVTLLLLDDDVEQDLLIAALAASAVPRDAVPRMVGYAETVVPRYSLDDFSDHFRMSRGAFEGVVRLVSLDYEIPVEHLRGRPPVEVDKQVLVTLWYLGNQSCILDIADRFGISTSTVHRTVWRVSRALRRLSASIVVWPSGQRARQIMDGFKDRKGVPGIIGAVDGTHIRIKVLQHDEGSYVNRKKFHSVILQGVCDDEMIFTDCVAGWPGSVHDSRVFANSELYQEATSNNAVLFPGGSFLLGDTGYPLMTWCLTPFKDTGNLTPAQRKYNTYCSNSRCVIENAFSLLKGRWRRLKYVDVDDMRDLSTLIMACCVLHNFTILAGEDTEQFMDANNDEVDIPPALGVGAGATDKRNELVQIIQALP